MIGLMAVTGNLDAPGGNVFFVPPPVRVVSEFGRHRDLSREQRKKRLGGEQYKLASRVALITPKVAWDATTRFSILGFALEGRLFKKRLQRQILSRRQTKFVKKCFASHILSCRPDPDPFPRET